MKHPCKIKCVTENLLNEKWFTNNSYIKLIHVATYVVHTVLHW